MEKSRFSLALLFPVLAVITVAVFAGGLGVIFMVLNETELGELGVIVLGMALVVGVPAIAALLERMVERS